MNTPPNPAIRTPRRHPHPPHAHTSHIGPPLDGGQVNVVRRESADAMEDFRRMCVAEKQPLLDTIASLRTAAARAEQERERVAQGHSADRRCVWEGWGRGLEP